MNPSDQQVLLARIVRDGISVREAEQMAGALNAGRKSTSGKGREAEQPQNRKAPEVRELEQRLIEKLGTKVEVKGSGK